MRPRSLALAVLLPLVSLEPCAAQERGGALVDVDLTDASLQRAVRAIARQAGQNIVVDRGIEERVSIRLRQTPWRDALAIMARLARCEIEKSIEGVLLLVQRPQVTLDFQDANIRTVVELIAAYSGKSVVLAPEVAGRVEVHLNDALWRDALSSCVEGAGPFRAVEDSAGLIRVVPADRAPRGVKPRRNLAGEPRVSVDVANKDLGALIRDIARRSGRKIRVAPNVKARLSLRLASAPLSSALAVIARLADLRLGQSADGAPIFEAVERWTLEARDEDARSVVKRLAARFQRSIKLPKDFGGALTLRIRDMPWRAALRSIAAAIGPYRVTEDERGVLELVRRKTY